MDKEQLAKMVADKIDEALKSGEHPKKFFLTENGRGVVDGGDLYNAVLKDALDVMKVAFVEILQELAASASASAQTSAKTPEKTPEKSTKGSTRR